VKCHVHPLFGVFQATDATYAPGMPPKPLHVAMVGTRGVPARYGGFETAVEEIGSRLAARGHRVRIYCRRGPETEADAGPARTEYLGMELVTLPAARRRSLETLSHTALSVAHLARHRTDVAFVFNAANAPLLPVLRAARIPVATHVDGLEWRRAKWGPTGQRYYRAAETAAVRLSDALIADAQGIADYYRDEYGADSRLITYGAPDLTDVGNDRLAELGLTPNGYHLVVARFEPENHVDVIVEGYVAGDAVRPLVVVGSAPYSHGYTRRISDLAASDPRVRLLGGVWDQDLLDQLYAGALTYLHGHSVGGTNPSLLRAIGGGTATAAYDVGFNHDVLGDAGRYFRTPADVAARLAEAEDDVAGCADRGKALAERATAYDWDLVADGYEQLAHDLAARRTPGPKRLARRLNAPEWAWSGTVASDD
jgi:glycosyltransferase involved in cell wall biosynthesis